jgi:lipoyl synthase
VSEAEALFRLPWPDLQRRAWEVRQRHHENALAFAVPGIKRYDTEDYQNHSGRFVSVSLTGEHCELHCEHCRGQLLHGMRPATTPEALLQIGQDVLRQGGEGLLISGGCDVRGAVPVSAHLGAIAQLKRWGLKVIVHTGLLDRAAAEGLKAAGVDQALFDVVGDAETIHDVLHLERSPADYAETLALLHGVGLPTAPHVVIGLHGGELRGELAALEMIRAIEPVAIVLVALRPLPGAPLAGAQSIAPEVVGCLAAVARLMYPSVPLALGCARPVGASKIELERRALLAGVNAMAFPDPATVRLAGEMGLRWRFVEACCALALGMPDRPSANGPASVPNMQFSL